MLTLALSLTLQLLQLHLVEDKEVAVVVVLLLLSVAEGELALLLAVPLLYTNDSVGSPSVSYFWLPCRVAPSVASWSTCDRPKRNSTEGRSRRTSNHLPDSIGKLCPSTDDPPLLSWTT